MLARQGVGDRSLELQEAPVLYPTPEEFADPVTYIASIEGLGKSTGILKIVPPSGWRLPVPHFAEDIPFETKRQRLDKLQVSGMCDGPGLGPVVYRQCRRPGWLHVLGGCTVWRWEQLYVTRVPEDGEQVH